MLTLKYPNNIISDIDKYRYCYRTQQLIQNEHNKKGQEYKDGKITIYEWKDFKKDWFRPRNDLISMEICENRNKIKEKAKNHNFNMTLNEIFIEEK